MREIKFRGRQIVDNEWAYGFVVITNMSGVFILDVVMKSVKNKDGVNIGDIISRHEIDGATLGQYTGLHDKNGKEIYEGDIYKTESGKVQPIIFHRGAFWLQHEDGGCWLELWRQYNYSNGEDQGCLWGEVIGNIHEVAP